MLSRRITIVSSSVIPSSAVVRERILHINIEMVRTELLFIIHKMKILGIYLKTILLIPYRKFRSLKITVPHDLSRAILKLSSLRVLHTKHLGSQHRKTILVPLHDRFRTTFSIQFQTKLFFHNVPCLPSFSFSLIAITVHALHKR